jgi:hypothetical protein
VSGETKRSWRVLLDSIRLERPMSTRELSAKGGWGRSWFGVCLTYSSSTVVSDREAISQLLAATGVHAVPHGEEKLIFTHPSIDVEKVLSSSWNITLVGTIPSAAGRGLGSKLVQLVLDRSKDDGRGVWVPTTFEPRVS